MSNIGHTWQHTRVVLDLWPQFQTLYQRTPKGHQELCTQTHVLVGHKITSKVFHKSNKSDTNCRLSCTVLMTFSMMITILITIKHNLKLSLYHIKQFKFIKNAPFRHLKKILKIRKSIKIKTSNLRQIKVMKCFLFETQNRLIMQVKFYLFYGRLWGRYILMS